MTKISIFDIREHMQNWEKIKYRRDNWREFAKQYVPKHFSDIEPGKFGIYHAGIYRRKKPYEYQSMLCMVLETGPEIKILCEEDIIHLIPKDLDNWFFVKITNCLEDMNIAITGAGVFPRIVYESLIQVNGGRYSSTINKYTTHLINVASEENTKIKAAKNKKIKLINEVEFFKMIQ